MCLCLFFTESNGALGIQEPTPVGNVWTSEHPLTKAAPRAPCGASADWFTNRKRQAMPSLGYFTWNSCWTCTWTGADPGVLVHFCRVSEAKIIAARCAMHRPAPKIRIPEPGTPVGTEEAPDPQSFSSYQWSWLCPTAPASSGKGVRTPVLTSTHTLRILVAAPGPRGVHTGLDLGIEPNRCGKWAFGYLGKKLRVLRE